MMRRNFSGHMGYAFFGLENLGVLIVCHLVDSLGAIASPCSASTTTPISASISPVVPAISTLPIKTSAVALLLDGVDLREFAR